MDPILDSGKAQGVVRLEVLYVVAPDDRPWTEVTAAELKNPRVVPIGRQASLEYVFRYRPKGTPGPATSITRPS